MVEHRLTLIFHALSDATRRSLLQEIKERPAKVTELASHYPISLNAISKHLKILERASLIKRSIKGRVHLCRANPDELEFAQQWIEHYTKFWNEKLNNLEAYINNE